MDPTTIHPHFSPKHSQDPALPMPLGTSGDQSAENNGGHSLLLPSLVLTLPAPASLTSSALLSP